MKTIFYERAQRVKHCFSPRENKIHILKPLCNFLLFYRQEGLPFFFLTPSANFIANCCISAAGISWSSLLSSSLVWNSLNNFQSYKSFLLGIKIILLLRERFCVSFRQLPESITRLFSPSIWQIVHKQEFELEITSSISSIVRISQIRYSSRGCSFV